MLRGLRTAAAVSAFLAAVLLAVPVYPVVAFERENTGDVLAYFPARDGTAFDLLYMHSIHRSPVLESYRVRGRLIVQRRMAYEDYGIGMPAGAEPHERFELRDGRIVISGMRREFRQVDMRVARVTASQELIVGGRQVPLTAFAAPGDWIRMRVRMVSGWQRLQGGNLLA